MAVLVLTVAGCGAAARAPADVTDPFAAPELRLAIETVPGRIAGAWPTPVVRGADGWAIPWFDGAVHLRLVGDDGGTVDRAIERGRLVGVAAIDGGYAVAVAAGGALRVHFLDGSDDDVLVSAPLDGDPVPALASDGARVLAAVTRGGDFAVDDPLPLDATLLLVGRDGARAIALGRVAAAPSLWGDARGFVVGRTLLVDGGGALGRAPGLQIRDARLFRRPFAAGVLPADDAVSLDGSAWLALDGLVGWADTSGGDGARVELVDAAGARALVQVGADLTPRARRPLPSTRLGDGGQDWVAAARGGRVVLAATVENDPVFALLRDDGDDAAAGLVRLRHASSRAAVVSPGARAVLFAWTEARTTIRYAVVRW